MHRLATEFKPILAPALDATGYHEEKKDRLRCAMLKLGKNAYSI